MKAFSAITAIALDLGTIELSVQVILSFTRVHLIVAGATLLLISQRGAVAKAPAVKPEPPLPAPTVSSGSVSSTIVPAGNALGD